MTITFALAEKTQRYTTTQDKDKYLHRIVKKFSTDDVNSRVSTIDTNTIAKESNGTPDSYNPASILEDQNFLLNSHKRTKQNTNRYFNDERISLPMIRNNSDINQKIPFGVKRISWSKNINRCLSKGNQGSTAEDPQAIFSENYYKTVEQESIPQNLHKESLQSHMGSQLKQRTRNNQNFAPRNTEIIKNIYAKGQNEQVILSQDYSRFNSIASRVCEWEANGVKWMWKSFDITSKANRNNCKLTPIIFFKTQTTNSYQSWMGNEYSSLDYDGKVNQGKN